MEKMSNDYVKYPRPFLGKLNNTTWKCVYAAVPEKELNVKKEELNV